jgi:hypothetical protein
MPKIIVKTTMGTYQEIISKDHRASSGYQARRAGLVELAPFHLRFPEPKNAPIAKNAISV